MARSPELALGVGHSVPKRKFRAANTARNHYITSNVVPHFFRLCAADFQQSYSSTSGFWLADHTNGNTAARAP